MAKCDLCGQDAGLLRKRHKECEARLQEGSAKIAALAREAALAWRLPESFQSEATQIASESFISGFQLYELFVTGFEQAVEAALGDGVLSQEEENSLQTFCKALSLSQGDVDRAGAYTRLVKAGVIRDILEGKVPDRFKVSADLPFNLQKGETLIWLFQQVKYYEERTTIKRQGSYQGVSLRIFKGVYYHIGGFRSEPVPVTQVVGDIGVLGITNKHIYFFGPAKSFRIAYSKIVSIAPYSDGIVIQRDSASAKPQIFVTGDGWFTHNLVSNLTRSAA